MLKLIFADLDDTLVAPDMSIPPENLRALDLAWERGVPFVPATGRGASMLPAALTQHPSVHYAVCGGGAILADVRSGEPLLVEAIEKDVVRAIYEDLRGLDLSFDLFADGAVHSAAGCWSVFERMDVSEPTRRLIMEGHVPFDGTTDELIDAVGEVCRINVFFVGEECGRRVYEVLDAHPEFSHVSSHSCNVELTRAGVTKGSGLVRLCEHLGVDPADTVAFGDSGNDVALIQAAGDGVAMANAAPEVLAVADHVTLSCIEGGVGRYLEPLLLELPVVRG